MKWLNDDSLIFIAVEGSENQINNWYCLKQNVQLIAHHVKKFAKIYLF